VEQAVKSWADAERIASGDTELGLDLAMRMVGEFGATCDDSVRIGYNAVKARRLIAARAAAQDAYWGTEPHHEVALRAVEVVYGALYSRLREDNEVVLPAVLIIREDLAELAAGMREMRDFVAGQCGSIAEQLAALRATVTEASASGADLGEATDGKRERIWPDLMPPRNRRFTARYGQLKQLSEYFPASGDVTIQIVHGMGGVGKSQLAAEFAYGVAENYDLVWWIPASEPALIAESARRLLVATGEVDTDLTDEVVVRATWSVLSRTKAWLLIFDNAEDETAIQRWIPTMPQSAGARQHAIVTTRRGGFTSLGNVVEVEVWDRGESVDYLTSRLGEIAMDQAERLADETGGLPLALEQASAYMTATAISLGEYVNLFETRRAEMLARGTVAGSEAVMATLWDISLTEVGRKDAAALQLVNLCAYMANTAIPLALFVEHADEITDPLRSVVSDTLALNDTIGVLLDYAICKRAGNSIVFHVLTQSAVEAKHRGAGARPIEHQDSVLRLLRAAFPEIVIGKSDQWARLEPWSDLMAHVLRASGRYLEGPGTEPDMAQVALDLLSTATSFSRIRGDYVGALREVERARTALESLEVSGDPRWRAGRLVDIAMAYKEVGQPESALPLARQAVEIMEDFADGPDLDLSIDTALVAKILFDLGRYREALPMAERALKGSLEAGAGARLLARRLNELGLIYLRMGAPSQAIGPMTKSRDLARAAVGERHVEYAGVLANVGAVHLALRLYETARGELEEALVLMEAATGDPRHPSVGEVLKQLLYFYNAVGERASAERVAERARDIFASIRA